MTTPEEIVPDEEPIDGEQPVGAELSLISDGDGLAVIGPPGAVEQFLISEGVASIALDLRRFAPQVAVGGAALQAGGLLAASSGRWVKMTEESYKLVKKYELMKNGTTGLEMGVVFAKGEKGGIKHLVQFTRSTGETLANPAFLAGLGGMLNQMALQASMDEISDYLAVIDEKVDDILRAQKDSVIADMIGVDLIIDDAMTTREHVGRVSEVAWSKVQGTAMTIARTQAYAIRQLDALAEKIERRTHVDERAKLAKEAAATVHQWLAILAHCFRLLDGVALLELDRVLDAAPEDLDRHRLALSANRQKRIEIFANSTNQLLARLDAAADDANTKVLLNPISARTVVGTSNHVGASVMEFQRVLELDGERTDVNAKRWREAVGDVRDKVVETGSAGVQAAKGFTVGTFAAAKGAGADGLDRARSLTHKISSRIAERTRRSLDEDTVATDSDESPDERQ